MEQVASSRLHLCCNRPMSVETKIFAPWRYLTLHRPQSHNCGSDFAFGLQPMEVLLARIDSFWTLICSESFCVSDASAQQTSTFVFWSLSEPNLILTDQVTAFIGKCVRRNVVFLQVLRWIEFIAENGSQPNHHCVAFTLLFCNLQWPSILSTPNDYVQVGTLHALFNDCL